MVHQAIPPAMTCPGCRARNLEGAGVCAGCGRALGPARKLAPGALIASRYEVLRQLGAGGMGLVFEAHDRTLDLRVAVKIVRSSSLDEAAAARFRSEIKLAWKVRHKNVASIHEYGEDGDLLFISMELVNGSDLRQLLEERGAFHWEQGYEVALQIGAALEAIHDAGVIHRDLKSANVMIEPSGLVRVMDFGIAKAGDEQESGLTATGQVVGSPEYMSPEQVAGRALDFRSDLYAFGIVIYEIFTGRVPFHGDSPIGTMLMHLQDPPPLDGPAAAQLPVALVDVLKKALAKDPAGRYRSCGEMNAALLAARAALEGQSTDETPAASASSPVQDSGEQPTRIVRARGGVAAASAAAPEAAPPEARLLLPTLVRALEHPQADVRASAARCIASLGASAETAVPALGGALADPVSAVRLEAVRALEGMGPAASGARAGLERACADADSGVRGLATQTLTRLVRPALGREARSPEPEAAPPPPLVSSIEPQAPVPDTAGAVEAATTREPVALARENVAVAARPTPSRHDPARRAGRPEKASSVMGRGPRQVAYAAFAAAALVGALWAFGTFQTDGVAQRPLASPTPVVSATPPSPWPTPSPAPSESTVAASTPPTNPPAPIKTPLPSVPPTTLRLPEPSVAPSVPPSSAPPTWPSPSPPSNEASGSFPQPSPAASGSSVPSEPAPPSPTPVVRGALVRLGDPGVTPPQRLDGPAPSYPLLAVQRNSQGTVELRLLVDENGQVAEIEVIKPVELLTAAAVKAVKGWTFDPARKGGVPVKVWIAQPVEFRLKR